MAEVIPFCGMIYNPEKVSDLSMVTTPPYDVISDVGQEAFYARHPNNVIRLILGRVFERDDERDNRYSRTASDLRSWEQNRVLISDTGTALYLTRVDFPCNGDQLSRYGIIARVRLEDFEKGIILPHEKTFSKVKSDRLSLMKACHMNFSPIFALFPDSGPIYGMLRDEAGNRPPESDFMDSEGHRQLLWRITAAEQIKQMTDAMAGLPIFIADGHHRYETALVYRDWVAQNDPAFSPTHPANYVMMSLTSMADPGMVILPAHRLLRSVGDGEIRALFEQMEACFDLARIPLDSSDPAAGIDLFERERQADPAVPTIGVYARGRSDLSVLRLKPGTMDRYRDELPLSLLNLDVTVLTRLILMDLMGFDQERLDNEKLISYATDASTAITRVRREGFDITFILNPTRIDQVQAVSREGRIMPRKSTYFFPKVVTGQVFNPLR